MLYDATNNAPGDVMYDLDGDGLVNEADLDIWVLDLYGTALTDFDLDYDTDVNDLNIWKANRFTSGKTMLDGDADFDSDVDVDDLILWKDNRFTSHGPMGGGAAAPEPGTLSLLAIGGLAILRRKKKI